MTAADQLSNNARLLREGDSDRFLTALFAPADRREGLFSLYAFNLELGRSAEHINEPMMGYIRLQWWRDRIAEIYVGDGPPKGAELAQALGQAVRAYNLPRQLFDAMLDAREQDFSPDAPASLAEFERYAQATAGGLIALALTVLGIPNDNDQKSTAQSTAYSAAMNLGMAWAIAGHLRAAAFHSRHNKQYLPGDILGPTAMVDLQNGRSSPALRQAARQMAQRAHEHLAAARDDALRLPKTALPVVLLAPLTGPYLRRLAAQDYDLFSPKLIIAKPRRQFMLAWHAWRGRY